MRTIIDESEDSYVTLAEVVTILVLFEAIPVLPRQSAPLRNKYVRIRRWILLMQNNSIDGNILTQANVLNPLKAFLSVQNQHVRTLKQTPEDIVEDLNILLTKWQLGDLSANPRRGLIPCGTRGWRPDPDWAFRHPYDFFGDGPFFNGQMWHSRAGMRRDGIHCQLIHGICGTIHRGARSLVAGLHDILSGKFYADIDQGDIFWYIGTCLLPQHLAHLATNIKEADFGAYPSGRITKNKNGEGPTNCTLMLYKSLQTGIEVRLIRSSNLAPIVEMRPIKGYRYDGLYVVVEMELLNREWQIYRFKLIRNTTGQGPLRHANPPPRPEPGNGRRR